MNAIRVHEFGDPEVMRLEAVEDPVAGPGQVVVRVRAVGVNPVDAYIRSGGYGRMPLPYTPGFDAAGEVESVGEGGSGLAVGDRVYISGAVTGAYAEKALCEAREVHALPERVSFAQGAGVGVPYATAYRGLFQRARAVAGETVLVHGASGGVGLAAVQLARAAGLTVIGTAGSEEGRALAAAQGAHSVLDHGDKNHFARAKELTGGRGVDVIIELAAHVNLADDPSALARQGRIAIIGSRGALEVDPRAIMSLEAEVIGVQGRAGTDKERSAVFAAIGAGLENGTLSPVVGEERPLAEAPRAHREVLEGPARGKIVLMP